MQPGPPKQIVAAGRAPSAQTSTPLPADPKAREIIKAGRRALGEKEDDPDRRA
jgi:hypothetical protein